MQSVRASTLIPRGFVADERSMTLDGTLITVRPAGRNEPVPGVRNDIRADPQSIFSASCGFANCRPQGSPGAYCPAIPLRCRALRSAYFQRAV